MPGTPKYINNCRSFKVVRYFRDRRAGPKLRQCRKIAGITNSFFVTDGLRCRSHVPAASPLPAYNFETEIRFHAMDHAFKFIITCPDHDIEVVQDHSIHFEKGEAAIAKFYTALHNKLDLPLRHFSGPPEEFYGLVGKTPKGVELQVTLCNRFAAARANRSGNSFDISTKQKLKKMKNAITKELDEFLKDQWSTDPLQRIEMAEHYLEYMLTHLGAAAGVIGTITKATDLLIIREAMRRLFCPNTRGRPDKERRKAQDTVLATLCRHEKADKKLLSRTTGVRADNLTRRMAAARQRAASLVEKSAVQQHKRKMQKQQHHPPTRHYRCNDDIGGGETGNAATNIGVHRSLPEGVTNAFRVSIPHATITNKNTISAEKRRIVTDSVGIPRPAKIPKVDHQLDE